ncbi:uncharacterized protein LOC131649262 [Vicia villosa]|uniref:uncharacterized protein LOC131649262 n=1 Tax=Vicia villosa TaxID=3911 RepID=UPI00273BD3E2|nr:uncharacterized protein LOC131649262 [Vicia villosa]
MCGSSCLNKRKQLSFLIKREGYDLCLLQEVKVDSITDSLVFKLWGGTNMEWSFRLSCGISEVGINGMWRGLNVYVINVYSSCLITKKRLMWKELVDRKSRRLKERKGRSLTLLGQETEEFNDFIENLEVVDARAVGKKFTWFSRDRGAMSRLDRFLVSNCLMEVWKIDGQVIGCVKDWDPKPFKFFNDWTKHEDFILFVENAWKSLNGRGRVTYVLKEKLRGMRGKLRLWNMEIYGYLNLEDGEAVKDLNVLDYTKVSNDTMDVDSLVSRRTLASSRVWNVVKAKEGFLPQKERSTWFAEGDSHPRFFHKAMKIRIARNSIVGLNSARG